MLISTESRHWRCIIQNSLCQSQNFGRSPEVSQSCEDFGGSYFDFRREIDIHFAVAVVDICPYVERIRRWMIPALTDSRKSQSGSRPPTL